MSKFGFKIQCEESGKLMNPWGQWDDQDEPLFFTTDTIENCWHALKTDIPSKKGYYNFIQFNPKNNQNTKEIRVYFNGGKPRSIYE